MASLSRLGKQIEEVIAVLNAADARFALIGGLALNLEEVREYFGLFGREPLFEELLNETA